VFDAMHVFLVIDLHKFFCLYIHMPECNPLEEIIQKIEALPEYASEIEKRQMRTVEDIFTLLGLPVLPTIQPETLKVSVSLRAFKRTIDRILQQDRKNASRFPNALEEAILASALDLSATELNKISPEPSKTSETPSIPPEPPKKPKWWRFGW
jgi:hypothetical protein